jgi:hypothetical protein
MRLRELQEGMGGSSGGGTPGSAGAGGSSLGLPYPSTYEEENDKFKYNSPVQRQMSLTTEGPKDFDDMKLDSKGKQDSIDYFYKDHAPSMGKPVKAGRLGSYDIVTVTKGPTTLMFLVDANDSAVFYVAFDKYKDGVAVGNVRSNGTVKATDVYSYLVKKHGKLYSDGHQTPSGRKIWDNLTQYTNLTVTDVGDRLMATEEQQEMFNDHARMYDMMNDKNWPKDLQQEVLKKYVNNPDQGENFIADMEYKGLRRLDNYGLLQNTDNLQLITRLPQNIIDQINETWQMSIPKTQATSVSDLGYEKYIKQYGFLTKPAVAIDADIVMGTEKWVASIINGEKAKQCHILTPQGPGVEIKSPDKSLSPSRQKELAFVEEDKHWARDELPQLNIDDLKDEDIEETYMTFSQLKPVQTERVKGLVKKTLKMLKQGKHKPIVVDKKGYIVNGHHRYDAYEKLGATYVPVIKVNTTIEELIDKY